MENSTMKDLMAGPGIRQVTQLLPADEMETRLEYIQKIEKGQRAFRKNPSWGFTPYQYATLALVFLSSGLGATDKTWNMICLSPQLQTWWSHGYFGLKYLGHEDDKETGMSMAELQFVWMPHSHYDESTKRIDLNEEKDKARNIRVCVEHMFGGEPPCSPQCGRCTAISKVQAHEVRERYTIESGYVFPVVRRTEDIQKFKAMIQLQWAAFCVGSMSGAANHPKLLVGDDDDDDDEDYDDNDNDYEDNDYYDDDDDDDDDDDNQPAFVAPDSNRIEDWLESVQKSDDEEKAAVTPSASSS